MALVVLFCMLSITAYKRSFRTLFDAMQEYRVLSEKNESMGKKTTNVTLLTREIARLDDVIGKEDVTKEMVQQGIVNFISDGHPKILIYDLHPIHVYSDTNHNIITNQLDVIGSLNELLALGYDFEKKFQLSRVVSMNLYVAKSNARTNVLHLKVILQNYEASTGPKPKQQ